MKAIFNKSVSEFKEYIRKYSFGRWNPLVDVVETNDCRYAIQVGYQDVNGEPHLDTLAVMTSVEGVKQQLSNQLRVEIRKIFLGLDASVCHQEDKPWKYTAIVCLPSKKKKKGDEDNNEPCEENTKHVEFIVYAPEKYSARRKAMDRMNDQLKSGQLISEQRLEAV